MNGRMLYSLTAAMGLCLNSLGWAASPQSVNQQLADAVAGRLEAQNLGRDASVQISCEDGVVTLVGSVRDGKVKERILSETRYTPGVKLVRDGLEVSASVVPVQATVPTPPMAVEGNGGPLVEPAPLGAPGMHTPDMQAPPLPAYAWPTYAPYNNYSRVGYPQAYPYNAFPFIGPYYPFPKVPLGWRKVVLEWEDGHWYIGRASTPHDYWRVKFW